MNENTAPTIGEITDNIVDALNEFARIINVCAMDATEAAEALCRTLRAMNEYELEAPTLRAVATNRQWYLYTHGPVKIRRKWHNALRRKAKIAEKRCKYDIS